MTSRANTAKCTRPSCARAIRRIVVLCLIGLSASGRAEADANSSAAAQRLIAKYSKHSAVVERVLKEYYLNGYEMEKAHGLNGLLALDALGVDALFLNQRYPQVFGRALHSGGPESVQAVFTCWGPLLDIEGVKSPHVQRWLQVLASLERHQMDVLAKHPKALPAIAVSPEEVCRFLDGRSADADEPFLFIDYSRDPKGQVARLLVGLRQAGRFTKDFGEIGGFPGLMLYCAHSSLLDTLVPKFGVLPSYAIVQANAASLSDLRDSYSSDEIVTALLPYSASNEKNRAVREALARSAFGIRLLLEFGDKGAGCLAATGPLGADLLYGSYGQTEELREAVVRVLVDGKLAAWDALERYATNPKFRDILLKDYAVAAVLQIERADQLAMWRDHYESLPAKEKTRFNTVVSVLTTWSNTGEGEIDMIHERGAAYVNDTLSFVELAPGYDVVHLVKLLASGKVPTAGEWAWAAIDAAFLVADAVEIGGAVVLFFATPGVPDEAAVLSAMAAQNAARANAKAMCRGGKNVAVQAVRRKLAREIGEELSEIVAREGLDSIDDIAIAAARIGARRAGRALSEQQLEAEAKRIARELPRQAFFWALRRIASGTLTGDDGARLLKSSVRSMRLDDIQDVAQPSLRALGVQLLRSGPRKIGGKIVPWTKLIPEGAICRRIKEELAQNTVGYLAISHLGDVLDWIHRTEEADESQE